MEKQPQQAVPTQLAGMKSRNRRWVIPALLACATLSTNSYALLMSQDSSYGTGSITTDTDTGIQWLDPWLATANGGSSFRSFNDVRAQLGTGGHFEGFRYATRLEVETLLFSSLGINSVTSQSSGTATVTDKSGVANLMSFFGNTFEQSFGPGAYIRILDAVFDDGAGGADQAVLNSSQFGPTLGGGTVQFYTNPNVSSNTNPYGHWLVRDNALGSSTGSTPVDEPQGLLLFGAALAAALGLFRKGNSSSELAAAA